MSKVSGSEPELVNRANVRFREGDACCQALRTRFDLTASAFSGVAFTFPFSTGVLGSVIRASISTPDTPMRQDPLTRCRR